ncbi:hypothetical protein PIB30_053102 [Stylosanthes scabra]|uniref:Uncharacterized protein n=1 Tax=Stylosanthes scabra TaxID=79078 RepID=A0ABU6TKN9_9FABA|nr:hypothetical protein [Stylosanthes scabra]
MRWIPADLPSKLVEEITSGFCHLSLFSHLFIEKSPSSPPHPHRTVVDGSFDGERSHLWPLRCSSLKQTKSLSSVFEARPRRLCVSAVDGAAVSPPLSHPPPSLCRHCYHHRAVLIQRQVLRFDEEIRGVECRYALDVNVERAVDVLMHKRLLHLAHDPVNRPAIEVRLVQVPPVTDGNSAYSVQSDAIENESDQSSSKYSSRKSIHPPPAFGSSPNLEALALDANNTEEMDEEHSVHASSQYSRPMHEITFSTDDKPKLLSQVLLTQQ